MTWWLWVAVAAVLVAAVVAAAVVVTTRSRNARTEVLRQRFGSEYDRAVKGDGRRAGERALEERLRRRDRLAIASASASARAGYEGEWREIEAQFEEAELPALGRADALVATVLADCGYPMESFDQRAADISVDHPEAVEHYRRAHATYRRADDGKATREDLFEALQHYKALLEALLAGDSVPGRASSGAADQRPPERLGV